MPGWRFIKRTFAAATTRHPSARQTFDVALLDKLRRYRVITKRTRFTRMAGFTRRSLRLGQREDRKSTRLNSSHSQISYAVFCLKKKKKNEKIKTTATL